MNRPPDWISFVLVCFFLNPVISTPAKRQVSLDDLIHTALSFVKPIFDTSQPLQENPRILKKTGADHNPRAMDVLGASDAHLTNIPICQGNSQICKFISCTAHNFKHDDNFANLNLAAQLIGDKNMRQVISNNPEAITSVCHEQGLSIDQCKVFSRGFQLIDKFMNTIEPEQKVEAEPAYAEPPPESYLSNQLNDTPEMLMSVQPLSAPAGSHTWSTRNRLDEPKVKQVIRHTTANRTHPMGYTSKPSNTTRRAPRAQMPTKHYSTTSNQKQVIPRPKPSARPPREVDYEDDFYQETERNKRGADYYDAISVEAPDLKVESHSSAPVVQKLNCMQFIRDL